MTLSGGLNPGGLDTTAEHHLQHTLTAPRSRLVNAALQTFANEAGAVGERDLDKATSGRTATIAVRENP